MVREGLGNWKEKIGEPAALLKQKGNRFVA
jgi:hypothetical protein